MKQILSFFTLFLLCSTYIIGQNKLNKSNDHQRLKLTVLEPSNIEGMSNIASNTLKNKIKRLLVKNSLGSSSTSRFVVASNISIETKDVLSTAPVKHVYVLNVNLYIGDGIDGTLFATSTVRLKGVGESETKAYNAAFNNFNVNSTNLEEFISEGKNKIIEYYNAKCDILISEAQSLAKSGQFDLSLYKLSLIPDVCLECFNKTQPVIVEVYNMKINSECKQLMLKANAEWSKSPDYTGALKASNYLGSINPNSDCYNEALELNTSISDRLKELDNREWAYQLKQRQDNVDLTKALIEAARDVGVAYGENQPKNITYNYVRWW